MCRIIGKNEPALIICGLVIAADIVRRFEKFTQGKYDDK